MLAATQLSGFGSGIGGNDRYTVLLLHFDGQNNATTTADSSQYKHPVVTWSGGAKISTTQSKFGGSSLYIPDVNDSISIRGGSDCAYGTGDFTIDFWAYFPSVSGNGHLIEHRGNNPCPDIMRVGNVVHYLIGGSSVLAGNTVLSANTWYHIEYGRSGTTGKLFVSGTAQTATYTDTNDYINSSGSTRPIIGDFSEDQGSGQECYIDEMRISKGICRHTSNFTAPTVAYF